MNVNVQQLTPQQAKELRKVWQSEGFLEKVLADPNLPGVLKDSAPIICRAAAELSDEDFGRLLLGDIDVPLALSESEKKLFKKITPKKTG